MIRALPILTLDVMGRRGRRTTGEVVYCPRKRRTLPLEECVVCPRTLSIGEGEGAAVRCRPDVEGGDEGVGARLVNGAVRLAEDLAAPELAAVFAELRAHVLPVVDAVGRFVGVVCDADLAPRRGELEHLWRRRFADASARDLASRAESVVDSTAPAGVLRTMAAARARQITVVTPDNVPLALVSDLQALGWISS